MSESAEREARFLAVLEAAEHYLSCQHELASAIRAGFFSLARARYQMGTAKLCATYAPSSPPPPPRSGATPPAPSCHQVCLGPMYLRALLIVLIVCRWDFRSIRLLCRPHGVCGAVSQLCSIHRTLQCAATSVNNFSAFCAGPPDRCPMMDATWYHWQVSGTDDTRSELIASGDSLPAPSIQSKADGFSSSLIADLALRYASSSLADGGAHSGRAAEQAQPQPQLQHKASPLQWFGVLVSPHLRETAADFSSAVAAVEKLAAAQQKLCSLLADHVQCGQFTS